MTKSIREIEDLQCFGLKIIQDKSLYNFSSDAVILANFVELKKTDRAVEIGVGSGVISILLTAKTRCEHIVGFEAQKKMFCLAQENIKLNSLSDKIILFNDKIQNFDKYFEKNSFDVVYSNPPYMPEIDNDTINEVRKLSRHDNLLKINDLCKCASEMLKDRGKFYLVYSAERSCELIYTLIRNKLMPKEIFYTENGKGKVVLVVIKAVKNGSFGVKVLPNLITNDKSGDYIEKLKTKNFK